jgi:hypothetical protein
MKTPNYKTKIKLQHNWLSKSLESLEKDYWGDIPKNESYLVTTSYKLRKKQLKDFGTEDLRIMIGQNLGLEYLIPLAIEGLRENILAEGDFYEGDLLKSVLTSEVDYWKNNSANWNTVCELFQKNEELLRTCDTTNTIRNGWFDSYKEFEKIN